MQKAGITVQGKMSRYTALKAILEGGIAAEILAISSHKLKVRMWLDGFKFNLLI